MIIDFAQPCAPVASELSGKAVDKDELHVVASPSEERKVEEVKVSRSGSGISEEEAILLVKQGLFNSKRRAA
jgi:ribosomal protein L7/L12